MKKYFSQLRPTERRLVIGVLVVLFLVVNWWYVWPHFSDWSNLSQRLNAARVKLQLYQAAQAKIPALRAQVAKFESQGESVPLENQGIDLMRTINAEAAACGFSPQSYSRQITKTNDAFFIEQDQSINVVATEDQLINFLYNLCSGASMIRVRDLELQPDPPRYHLNARIGLVANYQKNSVPAAPEKKAAPAAAKTGVKISAPAKPGVILKSAMPKRATNSTAKIK